MSPAGGLQPLFCGMHRVGIHAAAALAERLSRPLKHEWQADREVPPPSIVKP